MSSRFSAKASRFGGWALLLGCLFGPAVVVAQPPDRPGVQVQVTSPSQRLEMIVNSSRILTLEHNVPRLMVDDPSVVRAAPLSPNQVQVSALKPGFTQLTVWDEKGAVRTVDLVVVGDARELENLLMTEFPEASLHVRPLSNSVVISGHVPRPDMVSRVIAMAEDYYPKVINNLTVSGAQQVLLHVKLMEVSRTKLRRLGFDWANFNDDFGIVQSASGLIGSYSLVPGLGNVASNRGETLAFGIFGDNNTFFGFLEALRRHNLVKVLAEPTLVTVSGRAASFNVGGEFPILVPQSLGTVSIEYREFGTRVDFVPIVLGNGTVRLEVRPQVSEVDISRGVVLNSTTVPGLRTRWVDTGVEMKAGQTLALAGLIQSTVEAENKGIPVLADLPWVGSAFRRVQEQTNEIELLILVTPEFVDAMDPHEVPPCGPGQLTVSPNNTEFYFKGFLEVPACPDNCAPGYPNGGPGYDPSYGGQSGYGPVPAAEEIAPPQPAPDSASHRTPTPAVRQDTVVQQSTRSGSTTVSISDSPSVAENQQNRAGRQSQRTASRAAGTSRTDSSPGLIGPAGYEVLR